eukprot:NODE_114_length_18474_cov_1.567510.p1 type:complete len:1327 gc:universal NODE_114_length_18474_cov_1.567510:18012-14032(-)
MLTTQDLQQVRFTISSILDFFIDTFHVAKFDTSIITTPEGSGEFTTILYNDEIHNYQEVIDIVSEALGAGESRGHEVAQAIDQKGRDSVFSGTYDDCCIVANKIRSIGLHCTVEEQCYALQQEKCFDLLIFLHDFINGDYNRPEELQGKIEMIFCQELLKCWHTRLTSVDTKYCFSAVGKEYEPFSLFEKPNEIKEMEQPMLERITNTLNPIFNRLVRVAHVDEDSDDEGDEYDQSIEFKGHLKPVDYELPEAVLDTFPEYTENTFCNYRIDYILYYQRKTWKTFRILINELLLKSFCFANTLSEVPDDQSVGNLNNVSKYRIFVPIMNRRDIFAVRYFRIYPLILWEVLFKEREPYNTVNELGVQILTVPSIAVMLEQKYNASYLFCEMLTKVIIYGQKKPFESVSKNDVTELHLPLINVNCEGIRKSLYQKIVHDLLFFVNTNELRDIIRSRIQERNALKSFMCLLTLIHGMDHQLRYQNRHISFESKSWRHAFNLSLTLNAIQQDISKVINEENISFVFSLFMQCCKYLHSLEGAVENNGASLHLLLYRFMSESIYNHSQIFKQSVSGDDEFIRNRLGFYLKNYNSTDILSQLLSVEVFSEQINSLMWIRNGQIPFYEISLQRLVRHGYGSIYIHDILVLQHFYKEDPLFFSTYSKLLDVDFNNLSELYHKDNTKGKLLLENMTHFLIIINSKFPSDFIQDFLTHILKVKNHLTSDLEDYFESSMYNEIQLSNIASSKLTKNGLEYQLLPNIACDPFHYFYNRSNMRDVLDKHEYRYPHDAMQSVNDMSPILVGILNCVKIWSQDELKSSVILEMLLQLSIRCQNSSVVSEVIELAQKCDTEGRLTLKSSIRQIDEIFETSFSKESEFIPKTNEIAKQKQKELLEKMQLNQKAAMTAYEKELADLSDDESESITLESPFLNLLHDSQNQIFHAYIPIKEECVYCKESLSGDFGYIAFIGIQPQIDNSAKYTIQISGCHLIHFECMNYSGLYQAFNGPVITEDLVSKLTVTCPICRSLSNCYVPIVSKGHYIHSISTKGPTLDRPLYESQEDVIKLDMETMETTAPDSKHFRHMQTVIETLVLHYTNDSFADTTLLPLLGSMIQVETLYRNSLGTSKSNILQKEYDLNERNQQFYSHYFYFLRYYWPKKSSSTDILTNNGYKMFFEDMVTLLDYPRILNVSVFKFVAPMIAKLSLQDRLSYLRLVRIFLTFTVGLNTIDINCNTLNREDALFREFQIHYDKVKEQVPVLFSLPAKFEDFFISDLRCLNCGQVPDYPCLCLLCGVISCFEVFHILFRVIAVSIKRQDTLSHQDMPNLAHLCLGLS